MGKNGSTMKELYSKDTEKSSSGTDSLPHQTTLSSLERKKQCLSPRQSTPNAVFTVHFPVGHMFGKWELIDTNRYRYKNLAHLAVRCQCGVEDLIFLGNLTSGKTHGCNACSRAARKIAPKWLMKRLSAAKDRCTNPNNPMWHRYGGRGVTFHWATAGDAAKWIMENLPLIPAKQIDRKDNNKGYQPGNLQWSTSAQNNRNRDGCMTPIDFMFDPKEWPYSEVKVRQFMSEGMTREEILARAETAVKEKRKGWRSMRKWFDPSDKGRVSIYPQAAFAQFPPDQWPYSEATVKSFFAQGMTRKEIIAQAAKTVENRVGRYKGIQEWFARNGYTTS